MKRLIICADGTWDTPDVIDTDKQSASQERLQSSPSEQEQKTLYNKPIREPTNVVKMARAIVPTAKDKTPQVVYYDTGVGTGLGFTTNLSGEASESAYQKIFWIAIDSWSTTTMKATISFCSGSAAAPSQSAVWQGCCTVAGF